MKKLLMVVTLVGLFASAAFAGGMKGTWTGKISDAKCGAKVDAACAKKCMEAGEKAVFVTDDGGKVIPITNPKAIAGHEGHHVKVTGTISKDMLTVKKVEMAEDMKPGGMN